MTKRQVYLDNAATTVCHKVVVEEMEKYFFTNYANPSSIHKMGSDAKKIIEYAKRNILKLLSIKNEKRIIFTSGATESANLAIRGILENINKSGVNIVTSTIEHPCVSRTYEDYKNEGIEIRKIPVNSDGIIDIKKLYKSVDKKTKLVSFIYVNNELGIIQDIQEIVQAVKSRNKKTLIHIDATQAMGKISCDLEGSDMISVSAHKLHGPKGVGALILNKNINIKTQITGGGQQEGFRSGTINTPGIAGFAKAAEVAYNNLEDNKIKFKEIYKYTIHKLQEIKGVKFNTPDKNISYNILNISVDGAIGEVLLHMLEIEGIYVSTSSACSSGDKEHNSVLQNLGFNKDRVNSSIRISFSESTTKEDVDYFTLKLKIAYERFKKIRRLNHN